MSKEAEFIAKIAEILEVDRSVLTPASDFRSSAPEWDSMKGFAILVMFQDDYDIELTLDDFLLCRTVAHLLERLGRPS